MTHGVQRPPPIKKKRKYTHTHTHVRALTDSPQRLHSPSGLRAIFHCPVLCWGRGPGTKGGEEETRRGPVDLLWIFLKKGEGGEGAVISLGYHKRLSARIHSAKTCASVRQSRSRMQNFPASSLQKSWDSQHPLISSNQHSAKNSAFTPPASLAHIPSACWPRHPHVVVLWAPVTKKKRKEKVQIRLIPAHGSRKTCMLSRRLITRVKPLAPLLRYLTRPESARALSSHRHHSHTYERTYMLAHTRRRRRNTC